MNCFEAKDRIIDLILGELTPEDEIVLKAHLEICSICTEELEFLSTCFQVCKESPGETCECQFVETYWDEFVVSVHEKISHEKMARNFPIYIVLPITLSALAGIFIGWYFFFRPSPRETAQQNPSFSLRESTRLVVTSSTHC